MADGQVVFEITGDKSKLDKTLSDTTASIQGEAKKWDSAVDDSSNNISNSLIGAFTAVVGSYSFTQIGKMLWQLGVESVDLASDLEEVQNVIDTTFGAEGAKQIEKWSKEAGKNFGITELQAKQYAGYIGAMLETSGISQDEALAMSMNLTEISADLASFYNLDFDTAFNKVYSGMAGMARPLRQIGIDLSVAAIEESAMAESMGESYKEMTLAEKYMVRYDEILRQTTLSQGDFVRTSDSYANSQKRIETAMTTLKAQLGEALLPIVSQVSNAIADMLEILAYTPEENIFDTAEDSMNDAVQSATKAQGILGYMESLQQKYGDTATKTEEWKKALEELKAVMPGVNTLINEETGELTATNEQLRAYIENMKQAAIEDAKKKAVQDVTDKYVQKQKEYYTAEVERDIAQNEADVAAWGLINLYTSELAKERKAKLKRGWTEAETADMLLDPEEVYKRYKMGEISFTDIWSGADVLTGGNNTLVAGYKKTYEEQIGIVNERNAKMTELANSIDALKLQVDIANEAVARMAAAASSASSALSSILTGGELPGGGADGSHANGLDNVPYDGYVAILHQGERVQTAAEAALARRYSLGGSSGFDYGAMGAAIGANLPNGGNMQIIWRGRVVADVLSEMQGDSYRNLERSGWRS